MRTTLLDAPLDLFKRSHDYKRQMQLSLEPQTRLSPEYIDLFNWCTAFEMKCLGLAVQALIEEKTGYNPNQPRVPAGSSDGGQWSNGGGSGGARKPSAMPSLFRIKPAYGMSDNLPDKDPLHLLEGGAARGGAYGGRSRPSIASKEGEYLSEARKIPKHVKETGKGSDKLTEAQAKKLVEWNKTNKNFNPEIEITNYSDGRAVYTFRVPAKDKTQAYKVYEKHVDVDGKTTDTYALTIRDGKLYEYKNKMQK